MIEIKDLTKIYSDGKDDEVKALDDINLTIEDKGLCFITGKSGCGKSTLLNILGGLDKYDSGEFIVNGKSINGFSKKEIDEYRRSKVGFVFQEYNLIEELSVGENLALALNLNGMKKDDKLIEKVLQEVDLSGYAGRKASKLSGGQKQRVAIARALIKNPEIILADEPTGNLDSASGECVFQLLKNLAKDKTVIVVSHDRESVDKYADRVIELKDGRIIYESNPACELKNSIEEKIENKGNSKNKKSLSLGSILKLGFGFLKKHLVRMTVAIILLALSLSFLGLCTTSAMYDEVQTEYNLLKEQNPNIIQFSKQQKLDSRLNRHAVTNIFTNSQIDRIQNSLPDYQFKKLYYLKDQYFTLDILATPDRNDDFYGLPAYGRVSFTQEELDYYGMKLISGRLPQKKDELAISRYMADWILAYGRYDSDLEENIKVNSYDEIIGFEARCEGYFTIVGIIDTGLDFERYQVLKEMPDNYSPKELDEYINIKDRFRDEMLYSVHNAFFVSQEYIHYNYELTYVNAKYQRKKSSISAMLGSDYKGEGAAFIKDNIEGYEVYKTTESDILQDDEVVMREDALSYIYRDYYGMYDLYKLITYDMLKEFLSVNPTIEMDVANYHDKDFDNPSSKTYKIVGVIKTDRDMENRPNTEYHFYFSENVVNSITPSDNNCVALFTKLSGDRKKDYNLVEFSQSQKEDNDYFFPLRWNMRSALDTNSANALGLYLVGIAGSLVFLVFATLMTMNYIATTISSSYKQIGILKALGASNKEIVAIYSVEALLIGLIAFVISIGGMIAGINMFNSWLVLRNGFADMLVIKILPLFIMFIVSMVSCILGSMIPLIKLSKKKPSQIIREK